MIPLRDWPENPFAITIPTSEPNQHCHLHFAILGDYEGTKVQTHFLILDILEYLTIFKDRPDGSIPYAFDVSNQKLRFNLVPVPQHPLGKEMAVGALDVLYKLVHDNEAIEFTALVVCNMISLGRFKVQFLDIRESVGNASLPLSVTAVQ